MQNRLATTGNTIAPLTETPVKPEKTAEKSQQKAGTAGRDTSKIAQLLGFDAEMSKKWLRQADSVLLGTDEVGRGCLAGPVVAAVVRIPELSARSALAKALAGLNDSKKLSPRKREELSAVLTENCQYAIGQASVEEIDKINILQASFLAMRRAIEQLVLTDSSVLLVDGNQKVAGLALRQIMVVGGDGISASIAAASVIAKVYRDSLMCRLHDEFPQYAWDSNKGYGSKNHCDAILENGLTIWHRRSFCARILHEQLSIGN